MNKLMFLWFAVKTTFCTCQPDHRINDFEKIRSHYKISKIGKLPAVVNESSGLARSKKAGSFLTHNDSGGKPELYEFDINGKLLSTERIPDAKNRDWEDLAEDENGTIYIGDFGNNSNQRNDLAIYKHKPGSPLTEKISFSYQNQSINPSSSKSPAFNCEAFFYHKNQLYLFSKEYDKNGSVKLYSLPVQPGKYSLSPMDSIRISSPVTAADISPDGKTFVLLTYGKILLFEVSGGKIDFSRPKGCFRFVKKQAEAILFLNNTDMLVTNEQGDMYRITYR
ncbi:hypothetical protein [Dyadobacter bucti]|uniref:hypothetical protein n=1 Tax=Dyadobacter bucti TaxID=2572203 RepID=UPI003F720F3B